MQCKLKMDEFKNLADFEPQTQRLVIQMSEHLKKICNTTRGCRRREKLKEFNVRIANIIEFTSNQVKKDLVEAEQQIKTLNNCLDRQFEKKWNLMEQISSLKRQVAQLECPKQTCKLKSDVICHSSIEKTD